MLSFSPLEAGIGSNLLLHIYIYYYIHIKQLKRNVCNVSPLRKRKAAAAPPAKTREDKNSELF